MDDVLSTLVRRFHEQHVYMLINEVLRTNSEIGEDGKYFIVFETGIVGNKLVVDTAYYLLVLNSEAWKKIAETYQNCVDTYRADRHGIEFHPLREGDMEIDEKCRALLWSVFMMIKASEMFTDIVKMIMKGFVPDNVDVAVAVEGDIKLDEERRLWIHSVRKIFDIKGLELNTVLTMPKIVILPTGKPVELGEEVDLDKILEIVKNA